MQRLSMNYTGIREYDMFNIDDIAEEPTCHVEVLNKLNKLNIVDTPQVWVGRVTINLSVHWFVYSYESISRLSIPMLKDEAIIKEYLLDSAHLKTVLTMLI